MYIPQAQLTDGANALNVRITPMAWIVRSKVPPVSLSAAVQEQLRQVTGLPVSNVQTMDEVVAEATSRQRFNMLLMSVFAGLALLLAVIGIYGLMAYSVEQRTHEIGIRMALGADRRDVVAMIVRQGITLAALGVAIGLASAFALTRFLTTLLYQYVRAVDWIVRNASDADISENLSASGATDPIWTIQAHDYSLIQQNANQQYLQQAQITVVVEVTEQ